MADSFVPAADVYALQAAVKRLNAAPDWREGLSALKAMAVAMEMPVLAWSPDVAHPSLNADMDAFLREQGWQDDVIALWWDRSVMLKSPLYIRCRTGDAPFVTGSADALPPGRPELRRIAAAMQDMGIVSLVTMPVHLPRGQVAMVSWGGPHSVEDARRLVQEFRTELVAAGHHLMRLYRHLTGVAVTHEAELSRLTLREWECLRLTAQGCREEEVATLVGLAPTTVRFHLDNVVGKLGASNRTHAVALAVQLGVLGPIS